MVKIEQKEYTDVWAFLILYKKIAYFIKRSGGEIIYYVYHLICCYNQDDNNFYYKQLYIIIIEAYVFRGTFSFSYNWFDVNVFSI